jgi:DNA-binding response OmpR family regulator
MNDDRKRVLLVDDDDEIICAVETALAQRGYEVIVARDGSEALVCAERDLPDLIILDVVMPKRSGFLVLDRIRRLAVGSPRIIMVTASDEPRHRSFAESRGVDAFVSKPFELGKLLKKVDALMQA